MHCCKVPIFLVLKKETVLILHLCKHSTSFCLQISVPDGAAHPSQCAYAAGRWHRDRQDILCAGHVDVPVVRTRVCPCICHLQCADYSKSCTGMCLHGECSYSRWTLNCTFPLYITIAHFHCILQLHISIAYYNCTFPLHITIAHPHFVLQLHMPIAYYNCTFPLYITIAHPHFILQLHMPTAYYNLSSYYDGT